MALSFTPTLLEILKADAQRFKDMLASKDLDSARPYLADMSNNIAFYLRGMEIDTMASKKSLSLGDEREIKQLKRVKDRFDRLLVAMQQPNLQPSSDGAKFYFQFVRMMVNLNE